MRGIFIIGTERSGSNLLRVILDAHPDVVVPHPPHVLRYLGDVHGQAGDPQLLVDDLLALVRGHIHPWAEIPSRAALVERVRADPSPAGAFLALYDLHAASEGAAQWACKSTFVVHHIDAILQRRPQARFLWLVRDVRDVAASSLRSVFNPYDPMLTAALWHEQQQVVIEAAARLGDQRILRLHYEDLLASPESTVERICDHVGISLHPEMLAFHQRERASQTAKLSASWENANKPVMRNNSGKWRKQLTPTQLQQVEGVARPTMQALGYAPETQGPTPTEGDFRRARARDWLLRAGGEWRSLRGDAIHWLRWRRRARIARMRLRERLR